MLLICVCVGLKDGSILIVVHKNVLLGFNAQEIAHYKYSRDSLRLDAYTLAMNPQLARVVGSDDLALFAEMVGIYIYTHTYIQTNIHHAYIHACMYACMHAHTYIHIYSVGGCYIDIYIYIYIYI